MEDISIDKISEMLKNPDLLNNLKNVVNGLSSTSNDKPDIVVDGAESVNEDEKGILETLSTSSILSSISKFLSENKAERIALLTALRPFLSEEKKSVLDGVLSLLKVAGTLLAINML